MPTMHLFRSVLSLLTRFVRVVFHVLCYIILSFVARQGWFKTTEITRLIVGHTHEAIDAFFRVRLFPCPCALLSCFDCFGFLVLQFIRDLQRSRNIHTLPELIHALQEKMPCGTEIVFMDRLGNWRELYSDHFNEAIKYYIKPLYYVFHRCVSPPYPLFSTLVLHPTPCSTLHDLHLGCCLTECSCLFQRPRWHSPCQVS